MRYIAHRGLFQGPNVNLENTPEQIDLAISKGYDAEIDVWVQGTELFLGHNYPLRKVELNWLAERPLWIHCKNIEAMEWFNMIGGFNYFWHQEDTVTLTSINVIWAYPGKQPIKGSIAVMPEIHNDNLDNCIGICSDYIERYK